VVGDASSDSFLCQTCCARCNQNTFKIKCVEVISAIAGNGLIRSTSGLRIDNGVAGRVLAIFMASDGNKRIRVKLGERSYDILIGRGLIQHAATFFQAAKLGKRGVVITDTTVAPLYADQLAKALNAGGITVTVVTVPAGESSKSLRQANQLLEKMPGLGLDRHSFVVGLGGGVAGDLAGFVAGTYLRGLAFVQIPTTLLAQVDSSVGGKTGVNLPQGKNLVGVFHQPQLVLADISLLTTLPERELRAGFAEVIKTAAIADARFFGWLEKNYRRVLRCEPAALTETVRRCCEIKAAVVGADEREGGRRAILNFGHTLGHALETMADYSGLLHGEAIAIGMNCAARLSVRHAGLSPAAATRIVNLCQTSGLPVRLGTAKGGPALQTAMRLDKKAIGGHLRFVLLRRLGQAVVSDAVTNTDIEEVINECR